MGPEILVGFVAVFISGGAIGSTGILLAQWLLKRMDGEPLPRRSLEAAEFDVLRGEVAEIGKHLRNLDARLDFTEQLIGGALPLAPPPARLPEPIPGEPVEDSETP
jgi:hypothetical protein